MSKRSQHNVMFLCAAGQNITKGKLSEHSVTCISLDANLKEERDWFRWRNWLVFLITDTKDDLLPPQSNYEESETWEGVNLQRRPFLCRGDQDLSCSGFVFYLDYTEQTNVFAIFLHSAPEHVGATLFGSPAKLFVSISVAPLCFNSSLLLCLFFQLFFAITDLFATAREVQHKITFFKHFYKVWNTIKM